MTKEKNVKLKKKMAENLNKEREGRTDKEMTKKDKENERRNEWKNRKRRKMN